MSELESKVKQIIAEKLGVSEDKVTQQAAFVDDLGADSLDQVELIAQSDLGCRYKKK